MKHVDGWLGRMVLPKTHKRKEKIPTQHKTLHHKCAICPRTDAKRIQLLGNDVRWLCKGCIEQNLKRDIQYTPHYSRAGEGIV